MDYWPNLPALQSATSRDNRSQIFVKSRDFQDQHTTQRDHKSCTAEKTRLQCPIKVIKTQFIPIITSYVKLNNCWPFRHLHDLFLSFKSCSFFTKDYEENWLNLHPKLRKGDLKLKKVGCCCCGVSLESSCHALFWL